MIKPILYGAVGFVFAGLLAGAGYYAGRETSGSQDAMALPDHNPAGIAKRAKPDANEAGSNLIGVWASADTGCATGYGSGYSDTGRFSEGDESSGVEGLWTIKSGELIREATSKYELDEMADADAHPIVTALHQINRFPIIKLSPDQLIFQDQGKRFSYVKCTDGKRIFLDGEQVGGS